MGDRYLDVYGDTYSDPSAPATRTTTVAAESRVTSVASESRTVTV